MVDFCALNNIRPEIEKIPMTGIDEAWSKVVEKKARYRFVMAFNNAGIQAPLTDAADEPADLFDRVNAINLRGVWTCMKHELKQMRHQPGARHLCP